MAPKTPPAILWSAAEAPEPPFAIWGCLARAWHRFPPRFLVALREGSWSHRRELSAFGYHCLRGSPLGRLGIAAWIGTDRLRLGHRLRVGSDAVLVPAAVRVRHGHAPQAFRSLPRDSPHIGDQDFGQGKSSSAGWQRCVLGHKSVAAFPNCAPRLGKPPRSSNQGDFPLSDGAEGDEVRCRTLIP